MTDGEGTRTDSSRKFSSLFTRSEWLLLLILAAVQFTNIIDFMIVMPLGPAYLEYFKVTPQQFGFMVAAYGVSAGIAGLIASRIMDRFDRKLTLLTLFAGFTAGTFFCAVAPTFPLLVLARTITGAFGGLMGSLVMAIVGDVFQEHRLGSATGIVMSAFSAASIAGVPAGLFLASHFGWRAPFGVLAGLAAVLLPVAGVVLPPVRGHLARRHGPAPGWLTVLLHPSHLRAYAFMTVVVTTSFTIFPYLMTYLEANVGRPQQEMGWIYFCGGLATTLTLPMVGRLSDRLGKLRVFRVLALGTAVPVLLLTNLPPTSLLVVLGITTLLFVVSSGRMVPAMAMISASAAPGQRGSFMSALTAVQHAAMGLSAVVAGVFVGQSKEGAPLTGFSAVGVMAVMASVASVLLAGRLRPGTARAKPADPVAAPATSNVKETTRFPTDAVTTPKAFPALSPEGAE
jgi:predicted MFS family arabinose efflux permease